MINKLEKIVIVGGGSAGWMSAAFLKKSFPKREVVVIESPNYPTIGVGESTLGGINYYLKYLEIDELEFMRASNAVYKLSIKFTDFYQKGDGGFHYPFGRPYENGLPMNAWLFKKNAFPKTPIQDFVRCYFPAAPLIENNKIHMNEQGEFDNFNPESDIAYQIDAIKFAGYLREIYCKKQGVSHILATIVDVKTDKNGITGLVLDSGEEITGDLYVDCTGFKAMLLGSALGEQFVSYEDKMPNNRTWAAQIPYKNKEKELEGFTNCTALGNGWVWNTPVWSRLGTGYVYSDKFTTPEDALEEFKQHLMSDKMVVPRTREELDKIKFRDIQFRIGHFEKTFVKNVVAIGLSAGFIEPLESNGLFTVHEFLFKLQKVLQRNGVNQIEKDIYNRTTSDMWKGFCSFVSMHYTLSMRDDTPYWINCRSRGLLDPENKDLNPLEVGSFKISGFPADNGGPGIIDGMNWITVGMNYFYMSNIDFKGNINFNTQIDKMHLDAFNELENRKNKWNAFAKNAPGMLEYHLKHIYLNGQNIKEENISSGPSFTYT